jgi:hypothetical protein
MLQEHATILTTRRYVTLQSGTEKLILQRNVLSLTTWETTASRMAVQVFVGTTVFSQWPIASPPFPISVPSPSHSCYSSALKMEAASSSKTPVPFHSVISLITRQDLVMWPCATCGRNWFHFGASEMMPNKWPVRAGVQSLAGERRMILFIPQPDYAVLNGCMINEWGTGREGGGKEGRKDEAVMA